MPDFTSRFLFDQTDLRGDLVKLESSYQEVLDTGHYPPPVANLLGEFMVASALLGATIKFDGILSLQARSQRDIGLIMAEYNSQGQLRAIARQAGEALTGDFNSLLGEGNLAITIQPNAGQRYQGLVALTGDSLATSIQHYFQQSEQLDSWLLLTADGTRAAGLMLQALPASAEPDPMRRREQWQHLTSLAATLQTTELLELDADQILFRLFHEQGVRLLPARPLQFHCSCSALRVGTALQAIGRPEAEALLREQGAISVSCEFCNSLYSLDAGDVARIFGDPQPIETH